jgi:hypothetical protein
MVVVRARLTPESVPTPIRRALAARDGRCRFPGCTARRCDAHHVTHWLDGGGTSLDNFMRLCRRHHTLLHEGGFSIERDVLGAGRSCGPTAGHWTPYPRRRSAALMRSRPAEAPTVSDAGTAPASTSATSSAFRQRPRLQELTDASSRNAIRGSQDQPPALGHLARQIHFDGRSRARVRPGFLECHPAVRDAPSADPFLRASIRRTRQAHALGKSLRCRRRAQSEQTDHERIERRP